MITKNAHSRGRSSYKGNLMAIPLEYDTRKVEKYYHKGNFLEDGDITGAYKFDCWVSELDEIISDFETIVGGEEVIEEAKFFKKILKARGCDKGWVIGAGILEEFVHTYKFDHHYPPRERRNPNDR